jgi:hypothetical protein
LLQTLPVVLLDDDGERRFSHGNPVSASAQPGKCRVYAGGRLLGLGEADDCGRVKPRRLVCS